MKDLTELKFISTNGYIIYPEVTGSPEGPKIQRGVYPTGAPVTISKGQTLSFSMDTQNPVLKIGDEVWFGKDDSLTFLGTVTSISSTRLFECKSDYAGTIPSASGIYTSSISTLSIEWKIKY